MIKLIEEGGTTGGSFKKNIDYIFCLPLRLCTMSMPSAHGGQKKLSDPLGLGLQQVESCQIGAGN